MALCRKGGLVIGSGLNFVFRRREINLESGSLVGFAVYDDVSAALSNDPIDNGQSEARPFSNLFGREKGLKDSPGCRLVHPNTSVAHSQQYIFSNLKRGSVARLAPRRD